MYFRNLPISSEKVRQVFFLLLIVAMLGLIFTNLAMFIPSLLGAVTLYVITRNFDFYLQEKKHWKPVWATLFIMVMCLFVLVIPFYFVIDLLVQKLGNTNTLMPQLTEGLKKIQEFIYNKIGVDVLSKDNMVKIQDFATNLSSSVLSGTFNTISSIGTMFFILFFMLESPRSFEKALTNMMPLKRTNRKLVGEKFRKLIMANAVGIPVVALAQGLVAFIGYTIFGAPDPVLLFALTTLGSMIPIVGAAIVYIPVCIYVFSTGDTANGVGLLIYCSLVVGLTDNVIRFTFLRKLENIHPLTTVFGIILGINLFGFIGLVFGPILVSMTVLMIQVYRDEFSDKYTAEIEKEDLEQQVKIAEDIIENKDLPK